MNAKTDLNDGQRKTLYRLFLLEGLDDEQCSALLAACPPPRLLAKGDTLCSDEPTLCVLLSGEAGAFRRGTDHFPVLLRRLGAGDVCGAAALFGGGGYVTEVVAQKSCVLLCIPEAVLRAAMQRDARIAENYIRFLSERVRFLNRRIVQLTDGQAESRVLGCLRAYADENGVIRLPCGLSQLALQLGMSRSSLYRALDTLTAEGRLTTENKQRRLLDK